MHRSSSISKNLLRIFLIALILLTVSVLPARTALGGGDAGQEDTAQEIGPVLNADPALDAHERLARARVAALAHSVAQQNRARLVNMPEDSSVSARPATVWTQSLIVARVWQLGLPVSGLVSHGYDKRTRHYGIDVKVDENTQIYAAADGVVVRSGWDETGYGQIVWLDHGHGLRTLYAHLNATLVEAGATVRRGEVIGLAGNSGHSTGPHLHFEVKQDRIKLDPLAFYPDGRAPMSDDFAAASAPIRSEDSKQ